MEAALRLAEKGFPKALPNPLVGSVIVHNHQVVATGFHQKYGSHHAEVNAIKAMPQGLNTADCTLYVTLEPCAHQGKTPPCADLIIAKGFKNVVVGSLDPNPLVAGKGIFKLKEAGIEVITGVLEDEVKKQNPRFFTYHEKKRPYFILKWAQTADGFISRWPVPSNRDENRISGPEANHFVHELRASNMAIMVGKNTVLSDNPQLTVRHTQGGNPVRVIVDKNLEVPRNMHVFDDSAPTIVLNALHDEVESEFLRFVKLDFSNSAILHLGTKLHELGIQSVLVEGGAILLESLLKKGLWDEVIVIENPDLRFKNGIKAPSFELKSPKKRLGKDNLYRFFNTGGLY